MQSLIMTTFSTVRGIVVLTSMFDQQAVKLLKAQQRKARLLAN